MIARSVLHALNEQFDLTSWRQEDTARPDPAEAVSRPPVASGSTAPHLLPIRASCPPPRTKQERLDELEQQERSLSAARRRLHDVIDFVRGLSPSDRSPQGEQLRHLEGKERELSSAVRSCTG